MKPNKVRLNRVKCRTMRYFLCPIATEIPIPHAASETSGVNELYVI